MTSPTDARANRERLLAMTAEEMEPAIARMTDAEVALELARQMREDGICLECERPRELNGEGLCLYCAQEARDLEAPAPPPLSDRGEFLRRWHSGETGWPR